MSRLDISNGLRLITYTGVEVKNSINLLGYHRVVRGQSDHVMTNGYVSSVLDKIVTKTRPKIAFTVKIWT